MSGQSRSPKDIIKEINDELQQAGIVPGIGIGNKAPIFTLPNQDNIMISLQEYLDKGPVILTFYRGDWCGYCKKELIALNDAIDNFDKYKANILAIAPQTPAKAKNFQEQFGFKFQLLSDIDFNTIKNYRIHFTLHQKIQEIYETKFLLDLPKLTTNETWELPVPATFIIDQSGTVIDQFVNMDYTIRMSPEEIIHVLENIPNNTRN